ncbi:MAG: class I SAM-dependent methyltransferase [Flavobacteriales bacterium]|nr:class I SAM-dependent methyltransferase [Flavobacteriales bacterium]
MTELSFNCPVCGNNSFTKTRELVDYFLSKERFGIIQCRTCGVLKTEPAPDAEHIGAYYESDEYLSHGDKQKGIFAFLYRLAKGYNLGWKGRLLKNLYPSTSFLDYGCGTGDLLSHCLELGFDVRGVEPNKSAKTQLSPLIQDKVVSPADELNSNRKYDVISLWHVLEHIPDPKEIIFELKKKLNVGGHLVIALPNNASADALHYGKHWAAWDVPRHLWHYRPEQIISMMTTQGFSHSESHPMWLDAYYVCLLSERYKKGNALSALFWATISNFKALFNKKERCSSQVYVFQMN